MSSEHYLSNASNLLFQITCPFLLVFGIFGNVMTIIVFRRMDDKSAMSTYYCALALSDMLFMFSGLPLQNWLLYQFNINVPCIHDVTCKISKASKHISSVWSAWYLVAMTMQRAASVVWPHRVNVVCTRKLSSVITVIITIVIMLTYSHLFYGYAIDSSMCGNQSCGNCNCTLIDTNYKNFIFNFFSLVDIVVASLGPFVLLIVSNIVIIKAVITSAKEARHRLSVGQSVQVTARESKASSLSVTLIALSVTFLMLTFPVRILSILVTNPEENTGKSHEVLSFVGDCLNIIFAANAVINFYLYCLTGAKFRTEIIRLLLSVKPKHKKKLEP